MSISLPLASILPEDPEDCIEILLNIITNLQIVKLERWSHGVPVLVESYEVQHFLSYFTAAERILS